MNRILCFLFGGVLISCGSPVTFGGKSEKIREMKIKTAQKFPTRKRFKDSFKYNFAANEYVKKIDLLASPPVEYSFNQKDRSTVKEVFFQGYVGDQITETFSTKTADKLDLLVVIDDSSSMQPYQKRLAPQLSPLLSHIGNTDWQIMVVSTTPIRKVSRETGGFVEIFGCPRKNPRDSFDDSLITKKQFEQDPVLAAKRFEWKVSIGDDSGDPIERGLYASVQGLNGECGDPTKPWTREGSHRAVLMLTDEENCGSDLDQNCDSKPDSDPNYFVKNVVKGTQFFALLHDKDKYADTCSDEGYVRKPQDYRAVIDLTNGMEGNICATQYEEILTEISKNIHPINKVEYKLKPASSRVDARVFIDGKATSLAYRIEGDLLKFLDKVPNEAEKISISYKVNVAPRLKTFQLMQSIDLSTVQVFVDGKKISQEEFFLSMRDGSTAPQLEFFREPPDLSRIEVIGKNPAEKLENVFLMSKNLPEDILPSTVEVLINDEKKEGVNFDPAHHRLTFDRPPQDGSRILLRFETRASRQTSYEIELPGDLKVKNLRIFDENTREELPGEIRKGSLVLPENVIRNGRKVVLNYQSFPAAGNLELHLPRVPIYESLSIKPTVAQDLSCIEKAHLQGTVLSFPCGGDYVEQITVEYSYLGDLLDRFKLPKVPEKREIVRVFIDERETARFKVVEDEIVINRQDLKSDSIVEAIIEGLLYY